MHQQQKKERKQQKHSSIKRQLSTLAKYSIRYFFTGYKLRWNFFVDEKNFLSFFFKWLVAKEFMLARWIFTTRLLSTIQKRPLLYLNRFTYNTINLNYFKIKNEFLLAVSESWKLLHSLPCFCFNASRSYVWNAV